MFENRAHAALQLAKKLRTGQFIQPVVMGVPRGGVIIAEIIARELNSELDVLITRKLRAELQPEIAFGAIAEGGQTYFTGEHYLKEDPDYLQGEIERQRREIKKRRDLIQPYLRSIEIRDREVIIIDDGIATGSTMLAGLITVKHRNPAKIVVAVPVASDSALSAIKLYCDEIITLIRPTYFLAVGQFYRSFPQVTDEKMVAVLKGFSSRMG